MKTTNQTELSKKLKISGTRVLEAVLKADLVEAVGLTTEVKIKKAASLSGV